MRFGACAEPPERLLSDSSARRGAARACRLALLLSRSFRTLPLSLYHCFLMATGELGKINARTPLSA